MPPVPPALLPVLLIGAALLGSCSSPPAAHDHARVATSGPPRSSPTWAAIIARSPPLHRRPRRTSTKVCACSTASTTTRPRPRSRRPRAAIRCARCARGVWRSPTAPTTTARPTPSASGGPRRGHPGPHARVHRGHRAGAGADRRARRAALGGAGGGPGCARPRLRRRHARGRAPLSRRPRRRDPLRRRAHEPAAVEPVEAGGCSPARHRGDRRSRWSGCWPPIPCTPGPTTSSSTRWRRDPDPRRAEAAADRLRT